MYRSSTYFYDRRDSGRLATLVLPLEVIKAPSGGIIRHIHCIEAVYLQESPHASDDEVVEAIAAVAPHPPTGSECGDVDEFDGDASSALNIIEDMFAGMFCSFNLEAASLLFALKGERI